MDTYFTEETYKNSSSIEKGTYEDCTFIDCKLASHDLRDYVFINCEFKGCDLSNTNILRAAFREVDFYDCKLIGLKFDECNDFLFEVNFNSCQLDFASFYQRKMSKTNFINCQLKEVDFSEANLTESNFDESDLSGAIFEATNLQKADFSTALNYQIDPESNQMKAAKFSSQGLLGLLAKYQLKIV